jgi:hypothetical protein
VMPNEGDAEKKSVEINTLAKISGLISLWYNFFLTLTGVKHITTRYGIKYKLFPKLLL